ncbi:MAG: 5-formyltetrahydrofolate cyclo-ligase [Deltaproteobacteria bacterium]|jgi:5-formyltetrahydrofolate cyclo-ligase|nr:5-formyltetrahydrofolate cyclo-ligase [Deltaproteobacteria bacterium]
MPKKALREELLAKRRHSSAETCLALSLEIQNRFLGSACFQMAKCLAAYSAVCNEVLTDQVARQTLADGKRLVYPRVVNADLEFVQVESPDQLSQGSFGVLEPTGEKAVPINEIDLVLVPVIAFDRSGHRLGYGRGFYDRTLAAADQDTLCVGLAYDFQIVDLLPVSEHDQPISILMTESKTLYF